MKYFNECSTIDEVRKLYKKLAIIHHPDKGGNTETMQAVNTEYAYACAQLIKGNGLSDEQINEAIHLSEEYRQVIEAIINLPGILIEIVGNWIWVTGDTKPVRDKLKESGFYFASKKVAWYYRNVAFRTRGNGAPLAEIRRKYGSETINRRQDKKIIETI